MKSISKKNRLMAAAFKTFPKVVFQEWLRMRRRSARLWYPDYKTLPRARQITCLDKAACLGAQMN